MATAGDNEADRAIPTDEVLLLLARQASLYAQLASLAQQQRSLITSDRSGPLLALLGRRQKLVAQLTEISSALDPVRRDWAGYREQFTAEQRADADRWLGEVQERLGHVIDSDERDAKLLAARRHAAAVSMGETYSGRHAIGAYRQSAQRPSRIDNVHTG